MGVAYHIGLAARDAAYVTLMRERHEGAAQARHDEASQAHLPWGRVPEAPRSAGHRAPEQVRRDAAPAAPPTVPAGAPANDVAPPAAAQADSGGGLPGTQAVALPPVPRDADGWGPAASVGQACVLTAALPTGWTSADVADAIRAGACWPRAWPPPGGHGGADLHVRVLSLIHI